MAERMRAMTIKALMQKMEYLRNEAQDTESYNELWAAVRLLCNLGLLDDKFLNAMWKKDQELFEESCFNG